MPDTYRFAYSPQSVYGHAVELVRRHRRRDGEVVVDLGCGFGAVAEPLRDLGLTYLGVDVDPDGLKDLAERGFETLRADTSDEDAAMAAVVDRLAGRPLAAIVSVDLLEHVPDGQAVLQAARRLARSAGGVPLVLAVPNVTHYDVAAKLLLGRWDVTPTGILDETHVAFFGAARLHQVTAAAGWVEVDCHDYELARSDQHFPADVAVLAPGAPLHALLLQLRTQASPGATVNEFVRAYLPMASVPHDGGDDGEPPFLSVLVRTQGRRPSTLLETLLSLAAQTCDDFEVLLLAHDVDPETLGALRDLVDTFEPDFATRVRVEPVEGGGRARPLNTGVRLARGRYVATLDDDDVAFAHWVEAFRAQAEERPGAVLRSVVAQQAVTDDDWGGRPAYRVVGRPTCPWPAEFNLLSHMYENYSPFCGFALPRSLFSDLGFAFDETLPVVEDWDVLLQAALWCGVVDSGEVTSLYRRWEAKHSSLHLHSEDTWRRAREVVLNKLDQRALCMPPQSVSAIHQLHDDVHLLRTQLRQLSADHHALAEHSHHWFTEATRLRQELDGVRESASWQMTGPFRLFGAVVRRALRRGGEPAA